MYISLAESEQNYPSHAYFSRMRKNVYVTPKSFLCFIDFYKVLYAKKFEDVNLLEKNADLAGKTVGHPGPSVQPL